MLNNLAWSVSQKYMPVRLIHCRCLPSWQTGVYVKAFYHWVQRTAKVSCQLNVMRQSYATIPVGWSEVCTQKQSSLQFFNVRDELFRRIRCGVSYCGTSWLQLSCSSDVWSFPSFCRCFCSSTVTFFLFLFLCFLFCCISKSIIVFVWVLFIWFALSIPVDKRLQYVLRLLFRIFCCDIFLPWDDVE